MDKKTQLSPYDQWQLERFGNIIPAINCTPDGELFETGIDQLNRFSEWMENKTALELMRDEEYNHIG